MKMTKSEYKRLVSESTGKSPLFKDTAIAFVVGGAVCDIGQFISNTAGSYGLDEKGKAAVTAVCLVFLSALLTALHLYDRIAKYAGAGLAVPITGFANAVVSPAMEFRAENLVSGTGAKMFLVAGPVIVYGVSASVIYGLILYFFGGA